MTTKLTKYTAEEEKLLVEQYTAGMDIADIAEVLNRTDRSVRAKLTSLQLYKKAPYTSKDGTVPMKKIEYVQKISEILGADEELMDSLEKCTKYVLKRLLDALENGPKVEKSPEN